MLGVLKRRFEPGMFAYMKGFYYVYDRPAYGSNRVCELSHELAIIHARICRVEGNIESYAWYHITTMNAVTGYIMMNTELFDERNKNNVYV